MSEEIKIIYNKRNNYTLLEESAPLDGKERTRNLPTLVRLFNFAAQEVTTIYDNLRMSNSAGGSGSSMDAKNFSEFDSKEELKIMHAKLKDLGGSPPEINWDEKKPHVFKQNTI